MRDLYFVVSFPQPLTWRGFSSFRYVGNVLSNLRIPNWINRYRSMSRIRLSPRGDGTGWHARVLRILKNILHTYCLPRCVSRVVIPDQQFHIRWFNNFNYCWCVPFRIETLLDLGVVICLVTGYTLGTSQSSYFLSPTPPLLSSISQHSPNWEHGWNIYCQQIKY